MLVFLESKESQHCQRIVIVVFGSHKISLFFCKNLFSKQFFPRSKKRFKGLEVRENPSKEFKDALFERHKQGDQHATSMLLEALKGVILNIAHRYKWMNFPREDLIAHGNIGLLRALQNYEPDKGDLATFAWRYVHGELFCFAREMGYSVRPAKGKRDRAMQSKLHSLFNKLKHEGYSTSEAIRISANRLGVEEDRVTAFLSIQNSDSLCTVSEALCERNNDAENALTKEAARTAIQDALDILKDRERQVVEMMFLSGDEKMSLTKIGTKLGMQRQMASRLLSSALPKLKEELELCGFSLHDLLENTDEQIEQPGRISQEEQGV